MLKGIAQQELQTCSVECSVSEYLECVSAKLQQAGIALGTIELDDENVLIFSILERRVERLNNLMNNVEKVGSKFRKDYKNVTNLLLSI